MFTKPLTRTLRYIIINPSPKQSAGAISHDLSHTLLKKLKLLWGELHIKSASFSTDNGQTIILSIFYCVSNNKNFIPKYLDNALTDFA